MVQDSADLSPVANRTPATRVSRTTLYLEAAATKKARSNMYLAYHRLVTSIVREVDGATTAATMIAVVQATALAAPNLVRFISRKRRLRFMPGADSCPPSRAIVSGTTLFETL